MGEWLCVYYEACVRAHAYARMCARARARPTHIHWSVPSFMYVSLVTNSREAMTTVLGPQMLPLLSCLNNCMYLVIPALHVTSVTFSSSPGDRKMEEERSHEKKSLEHCARQVGALLVCTSVPANLMISARHW